MTLDECYAQEESLGPTQRKLFPFLLNYVIISHKWDDEENICDHGYFELPSLDAFACIHATPEQRDKAFWLTIRRKQ